MVLVSWPINSYGGSTGLAPIQVSTRNEDLKTQNIIFLSGLNFDDKLFLVLSGRKAITKIDITKAMTPPSLLGMDRRMA